MWSPSKKYLLALKKKQAENRLLCGSAYCQDYLDYIYVNELGESIMHGYLTQALPKFPKKHDMRCIRFLDLRHNSASLFYANGVVLNDIDYMLSPHYK